MPSRSRLVILWLALFFWLSGLPFCFAQNVDEISLPDVAEPANAITKSTTDPYLALDRLIASAVQKHPSIAAARAEQGATQAEIASARGQYWPTPSMQVLQREGNTAAVLTVQQPLWAGGRLDAGLAAAQSRADSAQALVSDAQYNLALRMTAVWADWRQAHGRMEALTEGVGLLNGYAESVSRRIQGGASAEVDRELIAARLAQTQGDLADANSAERSALARLSQMVGQSLRTEDLTDHGEGVQIAVVTSPVSPLPTLEALLAQAVARSAALKRLESDIEAAKRGTDKKRAALWPVLSLRAQRDYDGGSDANNLAANDSQVMLVLEYAPGAGLSARADVDAAAAREIGLREGLDAARRELVEKVNIDYEEHLASLQRSSKLQRTAEANAKVLASYDRLFVAGKRSWLDVINAAREFTQVRTALADIQAKQLASRYRLRLHAWGAF